MMPKCITCALIDLQSVPKQIAESGFGSCKAHKLTGVYVSILRDRDCAEYQEAASDVVAKRVEWNNKMEGK